MMPMLPFLDYKYGLCTLIFACYWSFEKSAPIKVLNKFDTKSWSYCIMTVAHNIASLFQKVLFVFSTGSSIVSPFVTLAKDVTSVTQILDQSTTKMLTVVVKTLQSFCFKIALKVSNPFDLVPMNGLTFAMTLFLVSHSQR